MKPYNNICIYISITIYNKYYYNLRNLKNKTIN